MRSPYAALGVVGIALAGLWYAGGGTTALPTVAAAQPRVSEPIAHDNLAVYFVHGPDTFSAAKVATLQEALEGGWAVVLETGDVNQLAVENRSADYELFIQSGDIIKGGRQDRIIAIDMLLPPKSGQVSFRAHCVEHGRWSGRGTEAATHFASSTKFAAGSDIKYANAISQQSEVWKSVKENQDKLSANTGVKVNAAVSESSFQLALENPVVEAKIAEYERSLKAAGENPTNIVGVVFVVNGKVTGAEVYGSNELFRKAWPKLLSSAATEALAEKTDKSNARTPSAKEVERFLAVAGHEKNSGLMSDYPSLMSNLEGALSEVQAAPFPGQSEAIRTRPVTSGEAQSQLNPPPNTGQGSGGTADVIQEVQALQPAPNSNQFNLTQLEAAPTISAPGSSASGAGTRLKISRTGGAGGLVIESRDSKRQNAVIHKSYIKK